MYIELSEKFAVALSENGTEILWDVLDNARIAMRDGYHLVNCENRNTADIIAKKSADKGREDFASLFLEMKNSYLMEFSAVKESVSRYISIVPDSNTDFSQQSGRIEIGTDISKSMFFWNTPYFLMEDLGDGTFYHWIIDYIKKTIFPNYEKILFEYEEKRGGGGNIATDYKNHERKRLLFCIADSDAKSPDSPYGATAEKLKDCGKKDACTDFFVLTVHELENLFFSESFSESINPDGVDVEKIKEAIKNAEKIHPDFRKYYDVKKGFKKNEIIKNSYMLEALEQSEKCYCDSKPPCIEAENIEKIKCSHDVIRGYGRNYLSLFSELYAPNGILNTNRFADAAKRTPDFILDCWKQIENFIFTWCCAKKINTHGI